jgi:FtsP/CotA-like multicopper oxidase with cupredoxin domain
MLLVVLSAVVTFAEDSLLVQANDNRTPAGRFNHGVLELQFELRQGRWYPEDEKGPYLDVYGFAEKGHAPQSSGPLIRVPQGTKVRATVRNMLPLAAKIYGLHAHPGDPKEAVTLQPGESRKAQFLAGEPGTYLYWATTSGKSIDQRDEAETLLSGAFIVDTLDANQNDRIFVSAFGQKADAVSALTRKIFPSMASPGRTQRK